MFLWASRRARLRVEVPDNGPLDVHLTQLRAEDAEPLPVGQTAEMEAADAEGVAVLRLSTEGAQEPVRVRLWCAGVYPFILPGPGIVASHFPTPAPALRWADNVAFDLWCDIPEDLATVTLQAWQLAKVIGEVEAPDGRVPLRWLPTGVSQSVSEIAVQRRTGWWRLPLGSSRAGGRLTTLEGLPLFLLRPDARFPYARVDVAVTGPNGPVAARVTAVRAGQTMVARDILPGERAVLRLPPGPATIAASAGMQHVTVSQGLSLSTASRIQLDMAAPAALVPEPGWYCGDHHMHSYCEDGAQSPETVVRAARAQGLNYIFLTDVPEPLLAAGLTEHDAPGQFMALPGQEMTLPHVHCNALNNRTALPGPSYEEARRGEGSDHPGPSMWWPALKQADGGATLMLNHPAHSPEMAARHAYFRSWWVADAYPQIPLVENFDFPPWFQRLNDGRRLTGLWTTDSHDVMLYPPGERRTYVRIGGEFTSANLIEALEAGRCFNTRHPGALLYLTVNGAGPGEIALCGQEQGQDQMWLVDVRCHCSRPLERIDLICRGRVTRSWYPGGSTQFTASERLPLTDWALVQAHATEEPARKDGHRGTPLDLSGCIAFTNPVWLRHPTQGDGCSGPSRMH